MPKNLPVKCWCRRVSGTITGSLPHVRPRRDLVSWEKGAPAAFALLSHRGKSKLNKQMWFLTRKALQASCWPTWDCPLCIHNEQSEKTCCRILLLFCNVNRHDALKWQMKRASDKAPLSPWARVSQPHLERWKVPEHWDAPPGTRQEGSQEPECSQTLRNGLSMPGEVGWEEGITISAKSLSCSVWKHLTDPVRRELCTYIAVRLPDWTKKDTGHPVQFDFN